MSATICIYWSLLVFFGVLCQGIIGSLSEKDFDDTSELLHRQKRVINHIPEENRKQFITNFPYMVCIKEFRLPGFCAGAILTHNVVITSAKCVELELRRYKVYSGSARTIAAGVHAEAHNITGKHVNLVDHQFRPNDGIALITVSPYFIFSKTTFSIGLYEGDIHPGLHLIVSGWGCDLEQNFEITHPLHLRSITVPIISNHDCQMLYNRTFPIIESDICTLDVTGRKRCAPEDSGAPLVIEHNNMKSLVGIHLWNGGIIGRHNPDVFVNLQNLRYKFWIIQNMHNI